MKVERRDTLRAFLEHALGLAHLSRRGDGAVVLGSEARRRMPLPAELSDVSR